MPPIDRPLTQNYPELNPSTPPIQNQPEPKPSTETQPELDPPAQTEESIVLHEKNRASVISALVDIKDGFKDGIVSIIGKELQQFQQYCVLKGLSKFALLSEEMRTNPEFKEVVSR